MSDYTYSAEKGLRYEGEKLSKVEGADGSTPHSSCCGATLVVKKEYTDTHVYDVTRIERGANGEVEFAAYEFRKTYDGPDSNNFRVECSECGKSVDHESIESWEEE